MLRCKMWRVLAVAAMSGFCPCVFSRAAAGDQIITNGPVSLGVTDFGNLAFQTTGLRLANVGDVIVNDLPNGQFGDPSEGWGVSVGGTANTVGTASFGVKSGIKEDPPGTFFKDNFPFNATAGPLAFNPGTQTVMTTVHSTNIPGLDVIQTYSPSSSQFLFRDAVQIVNTGSNPLTHVRYRRVIDFDVPPTPFDEFISLHRGGSSLIRWSSDTGLVTADPITNPLNNGSPGEVKAGALNCDELVRNCDNFGPADQGAMFEFDFGNLAPSSTLNFSLFYGAAYSQADVLAALGQVGAEVYALGKSDTAHGPDLGTPGTFVLAFSNVGGTPLGPPPGQVPEPGSAAVLLGLAGGGLLFRASRRLKS